MWRLNIVVCGRSHTFSSAMVILALILHRLSWEAGHSEYRNRCHREDCVRHRSAGEIRAGSQIATLPIHRAARCQVTRAKNETTTLMGSQSTIGTINEESKRKLWARVCVVHGLRVPSNGRFGAQRPATVLGGCASFHQGQRLALAREGFSCERQVIFLSGWLAKIDFESLISDGKAGYYDTAGSMVLYTRESAILLANLDGNPTPCM